MIVIEYPSKKFVIKGKSIVNSNDTFSVKVVSKGKSELLKQSVPFLFEDNEKIKSIWLMIKMFIGLFNFLILHFYALAAEYDSKYEMDENLIVYRSRSNSVRRTE